MTRKQISAAWVLAFIILAGACVAVGSNMWLGMAASFALLAIHQMLDLELDG